ncbi:MAG: glycosyltransferase [Muribaculum sp.]|nr:glycosyltransferase [Muribaculum sp.]
MSEPVISTIIPVFNTGKYLRRCVDSILAQDVKTEIILVDDGSTDDSPAICDEYESRYDNIIVVHQPNSGVSCARNAGLRLAKGKYIHFADSDDFFGGGFYKNAINQLVAKDADIYSCSSFVQNATGDFITKLDGESVELLNPEQAIGELLKSEKISYSLCDKIFSRSVLNDIYFHIKIYHNEDFMFCYEALKSARNIVVTPHPYYYYCYNPGSAVNSSFNDKKATAISAQGIVNKDIHIFFPSLIKLADAQYFKVVIYLASQMVVSGYDNENVLSEVQRLVRTNISNILHSNLAVGYKVNALALSIGWNLLKFISRR